MQDLSFYTILTISIIVTILWTLKSLENNRLKEERKVLDILCGVVKLSSGQIWGIEEIPNYNELLLEAINNLSSGQIQKLLEHLKNYYSVEISSLEDASKILIDINEKIDDSESQKELSIIIETILAEMSTEKLMSLYEKYLNSYLLEDSNTPLDEAIIDNIPAVFKLITNTIGHNDRLVLRNELATAIDALATSNINDAGLTILKNEKVKMMTWLSC